MKGIELFYEEAKKRNFIIGDADTSSGESNGNFKIKNEEGKETTQNFKRIAEVYGTLAFYHFEPEDAISEIFNLIEMQLEILNEQKHD